MCSLAKLPLLVVVVLQGLLSGHTNVIYGPGRLCVEEGTDCSALQRASGGRGSELTCVHVRDRVDCLRKIRDNHADFGYFEAEDLNMAASAFPDQFESRIEISTGEEVERVYKLVHNESNPSPRTLCHPGFNHQRLYPRALYRPVTASADDFLPDIKSHIHALSQMWTAACIPGPWSLDPITDKQLKQQYPQLCQACHNQQCDTQDLYAGPGALTCLLDQAADAAFVSDKTLRDNRGKNPEVEKLFVHCQIPGEHIRPIGLGRPLCDWGRRPLPSLLFLRAPNIAVAPESKPLWVRSLTKNFKTVSEVLGLPKGTHFRALNPPITPSDAIKQSGHKPNFITPKNPVRFCVTSEDERSKCEDLRVAAQSYGVSAEVGVACLLDTTTAQCFPDIYFGNADVIALDGSDVYMVNKDFGFERLLTEMYRSAEEPASSSYYAVAVVRADSNITSFSQLLGRKSCHTGIGKTAGWKMPVATLLQLRLIDPQHCNFITAMAEYFSGGSCLPGARLPTYNKQSNYMDRLCHLCVGEGQDNCARNSAETFYSYTGALRCLIHGGGDVAFIKHTTVPSNTDGANPADWAVGLKSEDFKLLCPLASTAPVTDYQNCHLALVPAHEVVVSGRMTTSRQNQVRQMLLGAATVFGGTAPASKSFKLFGSYRGKSDLLFKDSAVGLKALTEDTVEEMRRKQEYFEKLDELHSCEVRVCALEEQMEDCQAMARAMVGQQFICVSARDRLDCVQRVVRGQVDMTPLPGSYLGFNADLRIIAFAKSPANSQDRFRYKAVMVVRRATVRGLGSLRGKKSCHTGYGRTTGWRIPLALLKHVGVVNPSCHAHQSSVEHEIVSVATAFNRACIPGRWANSDTLDLALKHKYRAMCSMCSSGSCDNDAYAGYQGALRCLTENGGDVAFSKLSEVQKFFTINNRSVDAQQFGLLCEDGRLLDVDSPNASECFWAARPWDTYVTHGGASDAKAQKLFWALSQAKRKGEEDLSANKWYSTTLGIQERFSDIYPALDVLKREEYYSESRMNVVEREELCEVEPLRFCVTSEEEKRKCEDLGLVLGLRGVRPGLDCTRAEDTDGCLARINHDTADVANLNVSQRILALTSYNLQDMLSEVHPGEENSTYYLVGVVKKDAGINTVSDLAGKITCSANPTNSSSIGMGEYINRNLTNCLAEDGDFFNSYREAFTCLASSSGDVAFIKHSTHSSTVVASDNSQENQTLSADNFVLVCEDGVKPITRENIRKCSVGRAPAKTVVTRASETAARQEDLHHLLLKAAEYFGDKTSFFRLFYNYFAEEHLLFNDNTTELVPSDSQHRTFLLKMIAQACGMYDMHQRTG